MHFRNFLLSVWIQQQHISYIHAFLSTLMSCCCVCCCILVVRDKSAAKLWIILLYILDASHLWYCIFCVLLFGFGFSIKSNKRNLFIRKVIAGKSIRSVILVQKKAEKTCFPWLHFFTVFFSGLFSICLKLPSYSSSISNTHWFKKEAKAPIFLVTSERRVMAEELTERYTI